MVTIDSLNRNSSSPYPTVPSPTTYDLPLSVLATIHELQTMTTTTTDR